MAMTSKERIGRILKRQSVDRVGAMESFWGETVQRWRDEGKIGPKESVHEHMGLEIMDCWAFNIAGNLDAKEEVISEDEETKTVRNSNGAVMRWWKNKAGTPEHIDFMVKDRSGWQEHIRPHLVNSGDFRRRINFEEYRTQKKRCEENGMFFCWGGVNAFESIHPVCGHEYMLMGMALDPDWVRDMAEVYSDLWIHLFEILVAEEGKPDGVWFYEDMGFKERPFMSPAMYKELIWPAHKKSFDFAHSMGLPVIVHSCGYVAPLVPGLMEAGMDCLQAMEVKAGMDVVELKKLYGDRLSFMGGMDVRTLITNDKKVIKAELERKLPIAMKDSGYILFSDHSIPSQVDYETYKYFLETGLKMGTY